MNNKELIAEIARRSGYTKDATQRMMRSLVDAVAQDLEQGEPVLFPGFGTFEVKKRLERTLVNPLVGKRLLIPPKLILSFKPVASIKEKLKNAGGTDNE